MKKDKLKVYFLEFILIAILTFALFVPNFNRVILGIGLTIVAIIISVMLPKRKILSLNKKMVTIIFIILAVLYLVAFYVMRNIFWIL